MRLLNFLSLNSHEMYFIGMFSEHWNFVSMIDVQSMVCANGAVHYGLRFVVVCFHVALWSFHLITIIMQTISKGIGLLKYLSGICRVYKIKSILAFICYSIHVSVSLNYAIILWRLWGCVLYLHHQIGSTDHETMVCAVCLNIFLNSHKVDFFQAFTYQMTSPTRSAWDILKINTNEWAIQYMCLCL